MSRRPPDNSHLRRRDPLEVLAYIATYQQQNRGRSPSQREIQRALDISAPSVVHNLERRLVAAGLLRIITRGRGFAAELEITAAGQMRLKEWHADQDGQGRTRDGSMEPGDGA